MRNDPDRDLVSRCRDPGSEEFEEAFGLLYRRYRERVFRLALRITGDPTDALDAAQEAFVLLYQKLGTFQFEAKFSSWLYRLVTNCAIDHLRRKKRFEREFPAGGDGDAEILGNLPEDDDLGPARRAEAGDFSRHIRSIIDSLSPKLRAVLVLRHLEGMSYEEVAETLALSLGTVKSRLSRAHAALARRLEPLLAAHPEYRDRLAQDSSIAASPPPSSPPTPSDHPKSR